MFSDTNEGNPNPPSLFFPFSNSHMIQNNDSLQTHFVSQSSTHNSILISNKEKAPKLRKKRKCDDGENPNPKKRAGKSDRHSKIHTAHGPRDRRMRLSVHIARKFFDLQDMLGFDKASKTIEWLFSQSSIAIRDLALNHGNQMIIGHSSLSDCEENNNGELTKIGGVSQAKESWDKARARARERTQEKEIITSPEKGQDRFEGNPKYLEELGFLRHLDQERHFPSEEVSTIENIMGIASPSTCNSIFDFEKDFSMSGGNEYSSNNMMSIFGNWDLMIPLTGNIVHEQNPDSDLAILF